MSKFLAPIHNWLFRKIKISESLEQRLLDVLSKGDETARASLGREAVDRFGEYTGAADLADQIDLTNIHGWLQDKISRSETRMAWYISRLASPEDFARARDAFYQAGVTEGSALGEAATPEDAFKAHNNCILEGMPCDHVNQITSQGPSALTWENTTDIHLENILAGGADPEQFHELRRSYVKGLFDEMGYDYSFRSADGNRLHTIRKNSEN